MPKRRGRPPGSKNKPKLVIERQPVIPEHEDAEPGSPLTRPPTNTPSSTRSNAVVDYVNVRQSRTASGNVPRSGTDVVNKKRPAPSAVEAKAPTKSRPAPVLTNLSSQDQADQVSIEDAVRRLAKWQQERDEELTRERQASTFNSLFVPPHLLNPWSSGLRPTGR